MNATAELHTRPYGEAFLNTLTERIVPGSSYFWAAHFSSQESKLGVQAVFSFANLMDELSVARQEVIADKSVWWHEELERLQQFEARHPVCCTLQFVLKQPSSNENHNHESIFSTLHRQLHGALMTQQGYIIDSQEAFNDYADLRLGTLHTLLELLHGSSIDKAQAFGQWAGRLQYLGIARSPSFYADERWLKTADPALGLAVGESPDNRLHTMVEAKPHRGNVSSEIILKHDLAWWEKPAAKASPSYSHQPLGFGGLFASWRAARQA